MKTLLASAEYQQMAFRERAMWTWLERVNYKHRVNRWYVVVQNSLFSEVALIRFWGNRGTDFQQMKLEPFVDAEKARDAADRLIRSKVRKGYRIVGDYEPTGLDAQPTDGKG